MVGVGALPDYAAGERYWRISALTDQGTAGAMMMVEGTFLALGVLAWLFFSWSEGVEKQRQGSRWPKAHGIEPRRGRAQRAVSAGDGARLEQRLRAGHRASDG